MNHSLLFLLFSILLLTRSSAQCQGFELNAGTGLIYRETFEPKLGVQYIGFNVNLSKRWFAAFSYEVNTYSDVPENWSPSEKNPFIEGSRQITESMDRYFRTLGPIELLLLDRGQGIYTFIGGGIGYRILNNPLSEICFSTQAAHTVKRQTGIGFSSVTHDENYNVIDYEPAFTFGNGSGLGFIYKIDFQRKVYKNLWTSGALSYSHRLFDGHEINFGYDYSIMLATRLGFIVKF